MGVERTVLGGESLLLELLRPGVKNTFLHFDCSDDDAIPKAGGLLRHRTDPTHAGPEYRGRGAPAAGFTPPERAGDPTDAQAQRGAWAVEGRKLRGKDTRLAKTFAMAVGIGGQAPDQEPSMDFVVMLVPKAVNKRRGGASFSASRGRGFVQVKCSDPPDLELELTVTLGEDLPPVRVRHNFDQASICTLPGDWDLERAVERESDSLNVLFEVEQCGLRLTRCPPAPTLDLTVPESGAGDETPFQDSDHAADWGSPSSWPGSDFVSPSVHVMTPTSADDVPQWCLVPGGLEQGWQVDVQWWEAWGPSAFAPAEEQPAQVWPAWDAAEAGMWPFWQSQSPPSSPRLAAADDFAFGDFREVSLESYEEEVRALRAKLAELEEAMEAMV